MPDWGNVLEWTFGMKHLVGRIDMTLKFLDMGIRQIAWKYPEAGLHPKWQAELGDVLIGLSKEDE